MEPGCRADSCPPAPPASRRCGSRAGSGPTVVIFVRALLFGDRVAGWPSMMVVILLGIGMVMLALGIVGLYVSKIYTEVKGRPLYILAESGGELDEPGDVPAR